MKNVIALIGNPNSGKTTLFNALTGTHQKTGNWTGVTTEKKTGVYRADKQIEIIDLPGLYSLCYHAQDEKVVLDYLKRTPPSVIINVVDGTNLERNLYLTLELIKLKIPIVLAVNMYDDLKKNNVLFYPEKLSKALDMPVVCVSALKNINVDKLIETAVSQNKAPKEIDNNTAGETPEQKYKFIEKVLDGVIVKKQTRAQKLTQKIDRILTHKIFAFPIFFAVMLFVYFCSIKIGGAFGGKITQLFNMLSERLQQYFVSASAPDWLIGLTCKAIINGMGTVCSFLPQILILFFMLTIIELCGYSSRIAFILDRFFRFFGLGGKSLLPIFVSCGCSVSGIMATRSIESKSERLMTIFLAPFMPCGAKIAVFGWFSTVFFGGSALIATSMYFLAIMVVALSGLVLKNFKIFKQDREEFILEMPCYRLPSVKDIILTLFEKIKEFTVKAGAIVFIITVSLWVLKSFGFSGYVGDSVEKSFLYYLGNCFKFLFYPLGFGNPQATVAIFSSALAKEAVVESLALFGANPITLFNNGYSVYAFMAFVLLSPPCSASIVVASRELKSKKLLATMLLFQTLTAYIVALLINGLGLLHSLSNGLILSIIVVIIILLMLIKAIKVCKKHKCGLCSNCKKVNKCKKHNTI